MTPAAQLIFMIGIAIALGLVIRCRFKRAQIAALLLAGQYAYQLLGFGDAESVLVVYGWAAIIDTVTMFAISRLRPCNLTADIILLSLIGVVIHAIGFVAYWLYVRPVYYELAIVALLCLQQLRLLLVRENDEHEEHNSVWSLAIRRANSIWAALMGQAR